METVGKLSNGVTFDDLDPDFKVVVFLDVKYLKNVAR